MKYLWAFGELRIQKRIHMQMICKSAVKNVSAAPRPTIPRMLGISLGEIQKDQSINSWNKFEYRLLFPPEMFSWKFGK